MKTCNHKFKDTKNCNIYKLARNRYAVCDCTDTVIYFIGSKRKIKKYLKYEVFVNI